MKREADSLWTTTSEIGGKGKKEEVFNIGKTALDQKWLKFTGGERSRER